MLVNREPSCRSLLALSPQDLVPAVYLCTGRIGAAHEPHGEMHVGGSTVSTTPPTLAPNPNHRMRTPRAFLCSRDHAVAVSGGEGGARASPRIRHAKP